MFERGAISAARASLRAPLRAADAVSRGAVTRLLARRAGEDQPAEDVDATLERELRSRSGGPLARATAAAELQFAAEENPYLERVLSSFEELWRPRQPAGQGPGES